MLFAVPTALAGPTLNGLTLAKCSRRQHCKGRVEALLHGSIFALCPLSSALEADGALGLWRCASAVTHFLTTSRPYFALLLKPVPSFP